MHFIVVLYIIYVQKVHVRINIYTYIFTLGPLLGGFSIAAQPPSRRDGKKNAVPKYAVGLAASYPFEKITTLAQMTMGFGYIAPEPTAMNVVSSIALKVQCPVDEKLTVASAVDYDNVRESLKVSFAGKFVCNKDTQINIKAYSDDNIHIEGALQQSLPSKLTITPGFKMSLFKEKCFLWGIKASLG